MNAKRVPLRAARTRSEQRRYRRAWIERRCKLSYDRVRAIVRAAGLGMRSISDAALVALVRAELDRRDAERVRHELVLQTLVAAVGRSKRWVQRALRRMQLRWEDVPIEQLRAERVLRERNRRARITEHRAHRAA